VGGIRGGRERGRNVERQQRAARRVWRVWRETAKGEGVWMEAAEKREGRAGRSWAYLEEEEEGVGHGVEVGKLVE
jgi:hypothetical protein